MKSKSIFWFSSKDILKQEVGDNIDALYVENNNGYKTNLPKKNTIMRIDKTANDEHLNSDERIFKHFF